MKDNQYKEKLEVISQLEKGERTNERTCCHVEYVHISVRTIRDNADRITESVKSGTEVSV